MYHLHPHSNNDHTYSIVLEIIQLLLLDCNCRYHGRHGDGVAIVPGHHDNMTIASDFEM